jgi:hypothetical protein
MTPLEKEIWENARKLKKLEKDYLKLLYEHSTPETKEDLWEYAEKLRVIGAEAFDIRNEILESFIGNLNIQVFDDSVKETLNKIRNDEQFYSISFFEEYSKSVEEKSGKSLGHAINFWQFLDAKSDEWYDDFYQRFHIIGYHQKIATIGPIISSSKIPSEAIVYFDEVRDAYALELYVSAIALCRSVLESSLYNKLKSIGLFKKSKIVQLDTEKQDKLYHLIRIAKQKKLLDYGTTDLANDIRKSANKILHPKKEQGKKSYISGKEAFIIITNTIKVLEKLYS